MYKCLKIYHNTQLSSNLQSPMQIITKQSARSNLPMSNSARHPLGLNPDQLRSKYKNEHLPSHDLHLGQNGMYQDPASKQWYQATITWLGKDPRSYIITTEEGVQYRKTQAHLKPYQPLNKKSEDEHLLQSNHMLTVNHERKKPHISDNLAQSRQKRDI